MKKTLKLSSALILLGSAMALTGCAGMNGRFGCDVTAGRSCMPVSQVNDRANAGYYSDKGSGGKQVSWSGNHSTQETSAMPSPNQAEPIRTSERVQRIWIAPYEDLSNNYHDPSTVYVVLEKPHWVGSPAKEIKATETQQDD